MNSIKPHLLAIRSLLVIVYLGVSAVLSCRAAEPVSFKSIDAEPLGDVSPQAIVLHDGWFLREEALCGNNGQSFSTPGFRADGWYRTSVPTTVLGALVRLGVYPDPYVGDNNNRIPDANTPGSPWSRPWWFQTTMRIPASYAGKITWLHLDGINYRAAVWVNGKQVASENQMVGMFRRYRFNISSLVHPGGANAVAVRIFPVDYAGIPGNREPGSDPGFQRNVTQMSALGWDWVPTARDRNMGIWQHVWIESSGPVAMWDPVAIPDVELPSANQAAVTLKIQAENTRPVSEATLIRARIELKGVSGTAIEVSKRIELPAHAIEEITLTPKEFPVLNVHNPRLWWPHGYGEQPLYKLTVTALTRDGVSYRRSLCFGMRKLGYFYRPAEFAHTLNPVPDGAYPSDYPPLQVERVFTVNGRPIRMVGGSMVPDFLLTWNAQRYRDEVRMMVEGNHTVVRAWGGGVILPDAFYNEADREGLLVWQDLGRSSFSAAWRKKESEIPAVDKGLYLANMRDVILRLRGRTSLLAWCGTNEAAMQTDIGVALQNEILPALDPERPWLPSTSTEPPWAREPLGTRSFGPYEIQTLKTYFDKYAHADDFLFKNEIGLESAPRYDSIASAIPRVGETPESGSWITPVLLHHGLPAKHMLAQISERVGEPANLADFVSISELFSAQAYRAIFEAANKYRAHNPGTMVWMTNAAWLDFNYQLYDWYLRPTASYYAVKSAIRPLHVQYSLDDHNLQIASTLKESIPVRIRATVVSAEGATEETRSYALTAQAEVTTPAGPAPVTVADGRFHFLRLDLLDAAGRELDRLVTWTQNDERWNPLLQMVPVRVAARVIGRSQEHGETEYRIRIQNTGAVPAVHTWIEVVSAATGEEVLPNFWSDNALNLMPGEQRDLAVHFKSDRHSGVKLRLIVEGFNVIPAEFATQPGDTVRHPSLQVDTLTLEKGAERPTLKISCSQTGSANGRWTIWPLAIAVDGQRVRTVRIALRGTSGATLQVSLAVAPGAHRIQAGARMIDVRVE
jgi:exo-1,4-beta-D-glucosaminidase